MKLEVLVGGAPVEPTTQGVYEVASGVDMVLRADADGQTVTDPQWLLDGQPWNAGEGITDTETNGVPSRACKPDAKYDKPITLKAKVGDQTIESSPAIKLAAPNRAGSGTDGGEGVNEVAVGEYDPAFAGVSAGVLLVVLVGVGYAGWEIVSSLLPVGGPVPTPGPTASATAVDPNKQISARTLSLIQLVTVFAGVFCLAVGAVFAALETRGRLRRSGVLTTELGVNTRGQLGDLIQALEPLRKFRGTAIAFTSGLILIVFGLWSVAPPLGGSATPESSSSPITTTDSPTPGVSGSGGASTPATAPSATSTASTKG